MSRKRAGKRAAHPAHVHNKRHPVVRHPHIPGGVKHRGHAAAVALDQAQRNAQAVAQAPPGPPLGGGLPVGPGPGGPAGPMMADVGGGGDGQAQGA